MVLPTALGLAARWAVGGARADAAGPWVKRGTAVVLLVLYYANASACLPGVVAEPDWDCLALVAVAAGLMCATGFAARFGVARVVRADPARRAALVFGVGMANNGAGLALAAGALTGAPWRSCLWSRSTSCSTSRRDGRTPDCGECNAALTRTRVPHAVVRVTS